MIAYMMWHPILQRDDTKKDGLHWLDHRVEIRNSFARKPVIVDKNFVDSGWKSYSVELTRVS